MGGFVAVICEYNTAQQPDNSVTCVRDFHVAVSSFIVLTVTYKL